MRAFDRNKKSNRFFIRQSRCVFRLEVRGTKGRAAFTETLDRDYLLSMSVFDYDSAIKHLYRLMDSQSKGCPFCASSEIIKKGHSSNGTQRYACKTCGRGFIGNAIPNSHIRTDKWKTFCGLYLKGISLHRCAARCGVCLKTAHYMKCRLVGIFRSNPSLPMVLSGELLLDRSDRTFIERG